MSWPKSRSGLNGLRSAPCTIFSTTTLSPRQVANKAYTVGCKKLERDHKQHKPKYHIREKLLINNTISKAEEVLNARTRRTNRRVMAAEDEDEELSDEFTIKKHSIIHHVSPLKQLNVEEDEEDEEDIPNNSINQQINSENHLLPRDCRSNTNHTKKIITSPITTI